MPASRVGPDPAFLAFMAEYYWGKKELKFLDLGCGIGRHTLFLADKGYHVASIDASKQACEKLSYTLLDQYRKLIDIININAVDLKLEPESFDCILAINIFDYLDLEEACQLSKLARGWLKPDGRLFAKMLTEDLPKQLAHPDIKWKIYGPQEMSRLFMGYDAHHMPETQYIEGYAVNNWIISATKDELTLGDKLKATRIYFQADKTETTRRLAADSLTKLEQVAKLDIQHLIPLPSHKGRCAIVGGAPSIKNNIEELKTFIEGDIIISINGAHEFLLKNNIIPRIHPLFEIDLRKVEDSTGGPPHKEVFYYICSHCDQSIFKQLEGYKRILWHAFDERPEYQKEVTKLFPGEPMITGGYETFFRALNIGLTLGFREFEVFGCDCSFEGNHSHFDGYHNDLKEIRIEVAAGTEETHRLFQTTPSLSYIANEFIRFCDVYQPGVKVKIHGDGLLRYLHQSKYPDLYGIQAERQGKTTQFLIGEMNG